MTNAKYPADNIKMAATTYGGNKDKMRCNPMNGTINPIR
jgi:hypothetical protein